MFKRFIIPAMALLAWMQIAIAAPAVTLTAPVNSTVYASPANIVLTANASDSTNAIAKVEFYKGTELIGTATSVPYTVNWTNVPSGVYSLTAKATNTQGASATSGTVYVMINAAPVVNLTAPSPNASYGSPASISLAATASDSDGKIRNVQFFNGNTLLATVATPPFTYQWSQATPGSYTLHATTTDNLGMVGISAPVTVTVGANAPPSVSITTPVPNQSFTAPANIVLNVAAGDADGSIAQVEFFQGNTLLGTLTAAPYSYLWSNVPAGQYSITVKATDNNGATATSMQVNVIVGGGSGQVFYIHADHLDTPRVITDGSNNVVWRWDNSDPFGNNVPTASAGFEFNLRFPGQYFDRETNLHYNFLRDGYDPATGGYIQPDPAGNMFYKNMAVRSVAARGPVNGAIVAQLYRDMPTYNQSYAYAKNNPISYIDSLGLGPWDKLYGLPKEFWKWFHRQDGGELIKELKDASGQVPKETARDWHEIWKKEKDQGGFFDPSMIPEFFIPFWWTPSETACSTLDCHPEYKPKVCN